MNLIILILLVASLIFEIRRGRITRTRLNNAAKQLEATRHMLYSFANTIGYRVSLRERYGNNVVDIEKIQKPFDDEADRLNRIDGDLALLMKELGFEPKDEYTPEKRERKLVAKAKASSTRRSVRGSRR